jgi:hypothetical protein
MINRKLFIYLNELKRVEFNENECADVEICTSDYCILEIHERLSPCFQNCDSDEKCKNASETRVNLFIDKTNSRANQTLDCTFEITPDEGKFCRIEIADLTNATRDAEFTFTGSKVDKKNTTGALFSKCFDIDFIPSVANSKFCSTLRFQGFYIPDPEIFLMLKYVQRTYRT